METKQSKQKQRNVVNRTKKMFKKIIRNINRERVPGTLIILPTPNAKRSVIDVPSLNIIVLSFIVEDFLFLLLS